MGGKRPDQYAIDPGEANATDHKTRVEDEHVHEEDKQKVVASEQKDLPELGMIPKHGENPAKAELKARKNAQKQDNEQQSQS